MKYIYLILAILCLSSKSGIAATYYVTDFEQAIKHKEIYHQSMPLSNEELIAELKKEKDKLDLELISQEEYDVFKEKIKLKLKLK